MLSYSRQSIDAADIQAVADALCSPMLTTGPRVPEFEARFAATVGAKHAVAVSSGTAALHAVMAALVRPGDEVIVPAITFAATANAALYVGARPVFADVDSDTLLIDPEDVRRKITDRTRAIIGVDYAGQAADYEALAEIASGPEGPIYVIADSAHSLGAGRSYGVVAQCWSLHAVKAVTTGEGGVVTADDEMLARWLRAFRNHGRDESGEMRSLGYNYRMTDFQAALGLSQLGKLERFVGRRREIAAIYDRLFEGTRVQPLKRVGPHAYHLYVVRVPDRDRAKEHLREKGLGAQVHYRPVYLHPYYRSLGYHPGLCPVAEQAAKEILSLPCHPGVSDVDAWRVAQELLAVA